MDMINNWYTEYVPCFYARRLLDKLTQLNNNVTRPVDIDEIKKSIHYAKKYHGSQMRQSGEPYYSHPIEVAYMLAEYTEQHMPKYFRTDMIVIAILHDTIEDTDLTKDMIAYVFGNQVANQVEALTRVKPDRKISSAEMVERLYKEQRYEALLIKLFDRLHNIQTISAKSPEKIKKIIEETISKFIFLSVVLEATTVEKELIEICYKHLLNIQEHQHKFPYQEYYQLPSLTL